MMLLNHNLSPHWRHQREDMAASDGASTSSDGVLARLIQEDEYRSISYQGTRPHPRAAMSGRGRDGRGTDPDYILAKHIQEEIDAESAKELERKGVGYGRRGHPFGADYEETDKVHHMDNNSSSSSCHDYMSPSHQPLIGSHPYDMEPHPTLISHDIDMSYEALSELEDVSQGVDRETLSRLTSTYYYRGIDSKSCAVCLSLFSHGDLLRSLPCLHVFHRTCVDQWMEDHIQCPVCMKDVK